MIFGGVGIAPSIAPAGIVRNGELPPATGNPLTPATTNLFPCVPLVYFPLVPMQRASMGLASGEERTATDLCQLGYAMLDFPDAEIEVSVGRIKADLASCYAEIGFQDPHNDNTIGDTPAFSDEAPGRPQLRRPASIVDGRKHQNSRLEETIALRRRARQSLLNRMARRFRG